MRIDRGLLNWGVFLIALGGVPLAVQQGWVDSSIASDLWRLWPLILVGVGLGLILRWTPFAWLGGALVAVTFGLVFGALMAGGISGISSACVGISSGESSISEDRGPASGSAFEMRLTLSCGELTVERAAGSEWTIRAVHDPDDPPTIAASASSLSIRQGDIGDGMFVLTQQARNEWQVGLPATAAIEAQLTLNAAEATIDLERGPLRSIDGTFNAADVFLGLSETTTPQPASLSLTFNASSGTLSLPDGSLAGHLTLNASSLDICVPASAELRVKLDATLATDDLGSAELERMADGWQTVGYDAASARIDLSISSTVSSISLKRAEVCP